MTRQEILAIAKPIFFNTEMVGALLKGSKTATRRVVKKAAVDDVLSSKARISYPETPDEQFIACLCNAPYEVGNYLYVRETWRMQNYGYHTDTDTYDGQELEYRADLSDIENEMYGRRGGCAPCQWHPSIHMPKEAARIFLLVTDVRVEQLQNITIDGIEQEGVLLSFPVIKMIDSEHLKKFVYLWDSTIKKQDLGRYSWKANPWVWVIEFERVIIP